MFTGTLMDGDRVVLENVELDLTRRAGSELGIHDGWMAVPKAIASALKEADWSRQGQFPGPPSYILDVNELPSSIQRMTIYVNRVKPRDPELSTVTFLTQISDL